MLAVPIIDTSFVVARRLKHGERSQRPTRPTSTSASSGAGSRRRAAVTMWAWCGTLAGAALATRFVPFREGGEWHLWETIAVAGIALVALAFSFYVVYVLEIVKLSSRSPRRSLDRARMRRSA